MKKTKKSLLILAAIAMAFLNACEEPKEDPRGNYLTDSYIVNFGNYTGSKSTITSFDVLTDSIYQNVYQNANGVELLSNVQSVGINDGKIYFMSNDGDKIDIVDAHTFEATINPISENITKPRFIVFDGNTAYVSCLGDVPIDGWDNVETSYIAKVDLSNNTVTKTIDLPGGPEGLAIVGNKLYCALNYVDSIAVMDLTTENIDYIQTPAVSSYFLKDASSNLYVSMVSTFSDFSMNTGIGYLNAQTNMLDTVYYLDGVSSDYGSIMQYGKDQSSIFIVASSWVQEGENWVQKGGINKFDTGNKEFSTFVTDLEGIKGLSVDPDWGYVYCFQADGVAIGTMDVYDEETNLMNSFKTGLSPSMAFFVK